MLRLRRQADIQHIFRTGERFFGAWAVLRVRRREDQSLPAQGLRLAVLTTRHFPNAVSRNRARRLVRETCRLLLRQAQETWDLIFVLRPGVLATTLTDRLQALGDLLRRAGVLAEKATAAV